MQGDVFFFFFFTSMWSACPFLKAGPLPWASQAIHWAAHFNSAMVCYTPQSAQSTGSVCARACQWVRVCAFQSVRAAAWIRQQSLQDQSLSMKSCTICKKCKRKKKKKRHLRHTVLFLLSLHLLSTDCFQWLTFFSCGHFNIYYVFFFVYYR